MLDAIRPRNVPMWRFFNEHVEAAGPVHLGSLEELKSGDRRAAELFVAALKGCRAVVDIGCGTGLPGLYIAPHVGGIVCVDAAPNMIAAARENAERLGITNASFHVGGTEGLPFGDAEFDGASLSGVLGSMDWEGVHHMIPEVWRVLGYGGRIAVLELDWQHVIATKPRRQAAIYVEDERLMLRVVERDVSPPLERDTKYLVDPDSRSGRQLRAEVSEKDRVAQDLDVKELDPADVLDAWYDEGARFGRETLRTSLKAAGFHSIRIAAPQLWKEQTLFAAAVK